MKRLLATTAFVLAMSPAFAGEHRGWSVDTPGHNRWGDGNAPGWHGRDGEYWRLRDHDDGGDDGNGGVTGTGSGTGTGASCALPARPRHSKGVSRYAAFRPRSRPYSRKIVPTMTNNSTSR